MATLYLVVLVLAMLILHGSNSHDGARLLPTVELEGRVQSAYGIADGYWHLSVNGSNSQRASLLQRARFAAITDNRSCWELAAAAPEPYTPQYRPQRRPPQDLPGGIPRAVWKWPGRISRRQFEDVPFYLRDRRGCHHCTFVLRYKVLGGQLYVDASRRRRSLEGQEEEATMVEEMLLSALHAFDLPDADVAVHLGDGTPQGLPVLQVNIDRGFAAAGFTFPKRQWLSALGPRQQQVNARCLEVRYPVSDRVPRAVWRGSTTDRVHDPVDEGNALDIVRARLHLFGRWYPQWLDAHLTVFAQQAFDTNCLETLMPPGPQLALEDFNRYAIILDADGNAWSDRFRLLAAFNTPILKQASNLTGYFEHVMAPGAVVSHYAPDMHDLPVVARQLLEQLQHGPHHLHHMAEQRQALAHQLLSQMAVIEAMGWAVANVARLSDWRPTLEPGYEIVPFNRCCGLNPALPREFVEAVKRHTPQREASHPPRV